MNTLRTKRAFTLVELLVVIAIIGILSSLVTVGVMAALRRGKEARVAMEMAQINLALESYKNKFGEYPPDLFDDMELVRHVKKRWPRFNIANAASIKQAINNAYGNGIDFTQAHTQAGALVVWLGGFPNPDGKFSGFSANPEAPFGYICNCDSDKKITAITGPNIGAVLSASEAITFGQKVGDVLNMARSLDKTSFLDLEWDKNVKLVTVFGGAVVPCFVHSLQSDVSAPYVYFRGKTDGGLTAYTYINGPNYVTKAIQFLDFGVAVPYIKSGGNPFDAGISPPPIWMEPSRFQLIFPGQDGNFGIVEPTGPTKTFGSVTIQFLDFRSFDLNAQDNELRQKDFDNITNFSDYQQIKSILP